MQRLFGQTLGHFIISYEKTAVRLSAESCANLKTIFHKSSKNYPMMALLRHCIHSPTEWKRASDL